MENYLVLGAAICASIAAVSDLRTGRIPNWLTYGALVIGVLLRTCLGGWRGLEQALLGMLLGGGIFFLLFLVRGMGAGDVKLMAAVGAWVGIRRIPLVIIAAAIAGGILAVIYMLFYRRVRSTVRNLWALTRFHLTSGVRPHPEINLQDQGAVRVPYALAIAAGTLYLLLSAEKMAGVIYGL